MRRLLTGGRQDPQCPAEAASPPPLSAFHSPCSILPPPPSKFFFDIERQLSARLAGEPLLRPAQQQPTPPAEAASDRSSPLETPPVLSATTTAESQNANVITLTDASETITSFHQQRQQNLSANVVGHKQQQQQKGIDAFFAALANASRDNGGSSSASYQQQQMSFVEPEHQNSRRNFFTQQSPIVARLSSELCAPQHVAHEPSAQPLVQKIQHVTNTSLSANLFVSALAAQHQQQLLHHSGIPSTDSSMKLLANLKSSNQAATPHSQPAQPQLDNPLDIQQINNQTSSSRSKIAEQQQLNTTAIMAMNSPLSPEGIFIVPNVRSVDPGPSLSKPIPLLGERMDLLQFKRKEPREWSSDDVVAWILDVARRHQIPCENLNLAKFANCSGPLLMLMNEQRFKEHDPNYGSLLFAEFCKLVTDENFIDEWMKVNGSVAAPSSALDPPLLKKPAASTLLQQTAFLGQLAIQQEKRQQQLLVESVKAVEPLVDSASVTGDFLRAAVANNQQRQKDAGGCPLPSLNRLLPSTSVATFRQHGLHVSPASQLQPSLVGPSAIASLSRMIQPIQQQQEAPNNSGEALINHQLSGTSNLMMAQHQRSHLLKPMTSAGTKRGVGRPAGSKNKIEKLVKRNKDGRPRKRSQHTKGNKLWEFIRDALKDPRTCPSIVRWEDPAEGVFRIVESERLAFLWGQKKNNQKMTYEKLSRAMRTYYEKEILVPVPKSGLYPKKLVYKFGPTAHGWRTAASLAVQAQLVLVGGSNI
uniref:ETS domain-containing protein n=1 Tax=Globodera pallida TaxID=36090 RepID=A0A183CBA8_GLOPA